MTIINGYMAWSGYNKLVEVLEKHGYEVVSERKLKEVIHFRITDEPLKPCLCGCGKMPVPGNRFIKGHNNRGEHHPKPFLGRKRPDHSKRMTGNKNPMFGKRHTKKSKSLMSMNVQMSVRNKRIEREKIEWEARRGEIGETLPEVQDAKNEKEEAHLPE